MDFKAQPRTIQDALCLKRKYIIPRFQREYSWENEELDTLFDDLLDNMLIENNKVVSSEYFVGSLVLVGDDDNSQNIERQVVDGQQRLTTFTIAFSVLCQLFKSLGEEKLGDVVHTYIVGEDENGEHYTRLISETPKPFFQYRIQQKNIDFTQKPTTQEEKRILNAYKFFISKLEEENLRKEIKRRFPSVDMTYVELLKVFRDQILKCKVIYVSVNSFDDAYVIFEVLNAKGKNLSPIDIIKNSIFSIVDTVEPIDTAYEKWNHIRRMISSAGMNDMITFYRHYWLSKYGFTTNRKLVEEFNKKVERNYSEYYNFLTNLESAAQDYVEITNPERTHWTQPEDLAVYETLFSLDVFGVKQVRSFLLALLNVKRENLVKHKEFIKILEQLEYFHFVFNAVCSERPSGLERRYSSYARKLRQCKTKKETADCLHELERVLDDTLPSYEDFYSKFVDIVYTSEETKDKKLVQYILKKLERYSSGTDEMQPNSFSIEHIMSESIREACVGSLGNLLPLGAQLNSDLEDKEYPEKIKGYKTSQYQSTQKFANEYGSEDWTKEKIAERTKKLSQILYYRNKIPQ